MWSSKLPSRLVAVGALVASSAAWTAVDLAALVVVPERGQTADQTRRDRYECHNWAVDQAGYVPTATGEDAPSRSQRADRVGRILNGASIGGALGGLIRGVQRKNPSNGVLAGAAVGAAVGAATSRSDDEERESADSDYVRALGACLEARGYQMAVPDEDGELVALTSD